MARHGRDQRRARHVRSRHVEMDRRGRWHLGRGFRGHASGAEGQSFACRAHAVELVGLDGKTGRRPGTGRQARRAVGHHGERRGSARSADGRCVFSRVLGSAASDHHVSRCRSRRPDRGQDASRRVQTARAGRLHGGRGAGPQRRMGGDQFHHQRSGRYAVPVRDERVRPFVGADQRPHGALLPFPEGRRAGEPGLGTGRFRPAAAFRRLNVSGL